MFSSSHWSFHKPEKSDRLFLAGRQVGAGHETSSTFSALLLCVMCLHVLSVCKTCTRVLSLVDHACWLVGWVSVDWCCVLEVTRVVHASVQCYGSHMCLHVHIYTHTHSGHCTHPPTHPHTHTHSHLPCTHTPTPTPTHTYPVPIYPHPHNANSNYHTIYTPSPLLPSAPYTAPTAAQPTTPTSPSSTLLPTEQPPPYSSVSGQNLFVQCRVCQHVIHVASGTQTRVVKCSNCREATVGEGRERGGDGWRQMSIVMRFCLKLSYCAKLLCLWL